MYVCVSQTDLEGSIKFVAAVNHGDVSIGTSEISMGTIRNINHVKPDGHI